MKTLSIISFICLTSAVAGAGTVDIQWEASTNWGPTEAEMRAVHGWKMDPPRVNIEFSADGGATWLYRIARGVPTLASATNIYTWTIPDDPAMLTTNGRVRVQALPYQDMQPGYAWPTNEPVWHVPGSTNVVTVSGLFILTPPPGATITNGAETVVRYVCNGAGMFASMGASTNGRDFVGIHVDMPANIPATNALIWEADAPTNTPVWLVIQSVSDPTMMDIGGPYTVVGP
jgi:hypothetical protein